jgi:hypothetical protein
MKTNKYFFLVSHSVLLRMKNISDMLQRTSKYTFYVQNLFFENRAVYEIMWKYIVERGWSQMTIWRMRIACCIPKNTNTHSEYLMLIVFHCNNGCTKTPQCYITRTLPFLLHHSFIFFCTHHTFLVNNVLKFKYPPGWYIDLLATIQAMYV